MTNTTSGKPEVNRRTFLYAAGATAIGVAGWEAGRRADAAGGSVRADATAVAHHRHAAVDTGAFRYPQGDPAYGQRGGRRPQPIRRRRSRLKLPDYFRPVAAAA